MKTLFKTGLIGIVLSIFFLAPAGYADNQNPYAGEYEILNKTLPAVSESDKIEVVEFFWYACPHCYELEHELDPWLVNKPDDVEFIRIPALFAKNHPWALLAKVYYTAKKLHVLDKVHTPLFEAIHVPEKRKPLLQVFAEHGVSKEQFMETFDFDIDDDIEKASEITKAYGIRGVPIIFVNGKYRITSENPIEVLDYLIEKERHAIGKQRNAQPQW